MKTKRTLRHKPAPRQKLTYRYVAGSVALTVLISIGTFFYLNLGVSTDSKAGPGDDHTSAVDLGDWTDGATWDTDPTAPGTTNISLDIEIAVNDTVFLVGDLSYSNGNRTLTVNGMLLIDGNLDMGKDTEIVVGSNGILIVTGNFSSGNKSDLTNNGIVAIEGDVSFHPSPQDDYVGGGDLYVGGAVSGNGDAGNSDNPLTDLESSNEDIYDLVTGGVDVLPVTLVYFIAQVQGDLVMLTWKTAEEINNDFFSIERSADGKTFETIATLPGAGNSHQPLTYTYQDTQPLPEVSYYRLKQTDFDGKFERFKAVAVSRSSRGGVEHSALEIHSIAPNPFDASFNVKFELSTGGSTVLQLIDFNGRVVASETVEATAGNNQYQFVLNGELESGVYLLQLSSGLHASKTVRVIKR